MQLTNKEIRILHFIDSLRLGGKERQHVELLKGLRKIANVNSLLVCMGTEDFYLSEIKKINVPLIFLIRKIRWDPIVFFKLLKIARDFKPDIIYTNSWMNSFYALPICKCLRIKCIDGSIRNAFSEGGLRWKLEKWLLRFSDFRVANSKTGLESRGFSTNSKRNVIIYNGFDLDRLKGVPDYKKMKNSLEIQNKKVVGMVAEFSDNKDYETYIKSAKMILRTRNDVVFLAIGDGKNLEICKKMVNKNCNDIKFLGVRKDIEALVSIFDIGILSTFTEGISNSIMEYMALGKPVIASDGGGSKEIVIDKKTGFLVPLRSPECLADKIVYLLNNPDIARKMGEAGRKRLEEKYSLDMLVENTMKLFKSALR